MDYLSSFTFSQITPLWPLLLAELKDFGHLWRAALEWGHVAGWSGGTHFASSSVAKVYTCGSDVLGKWGHERY